MFQAVRSQSCSRFVFPRKYVEIALQLRPQLSDDAVVVNIILPFFCVSRRATRDSTHTAARKSWRAPWTPPPWPSSTLTGSLAAYRRSRATFCFCCCLSRHVLTSPASNRGPSETAAFRPCGVTSDGLAARNRRQKLTNRLGSLVTSNEHTSLGFPMQQKRYLMATL